MKQSNAHKSKSTSSNDVDSPLNDPTKLRHFRFAQKYVELNFNGTQAYLNVYGKEYESLNGKVMSSQTAQSSSARLLSNDMVIQHINKIVSDEFEEAKVSIRAVLARYNRWADFSIFDVISIDEIEELDKDGKSHRPPRFKQKLRLKDKSEIPKHAQNCIKSISENNGEIKINTVCQLSANNMLFKYLDFGRKTKDTERNIVVRFDSLDEQL